MASVNKVILVGNLGADPEMRYLPSGEAVANLRLATTDTWKDKDGNKQEATEWHRVSFFGRHAEVCGQYLKKGSPVYVEGSIRTRKWQDKEGQDRYSLEVRLNELDLPEKSNIANVPAQKAPDSANSQKQKPVFDDLGDDVPW